MADGDLTTLDNVKAWLPDMAQVTAYDDLLSRLITAASRAVCNYTGRPIFDVLGYAELYDGGGQGFLVLRQWPATQVLSVALSDGTFLTDYTLEPPLAGGGAQRLVLAQDCFPRGRANITIDYEAGYGAIPDDVEQAVIELVGERFRARERIGLTSKGLGGQETTAYSAAAFSDTVLALLAPYRRVIPC